MFINAYEDIFYIFTTVVSHRTSSRYMVQQHRCQALLRQKLPGDKHFTL